uniref:Chitin-binding type-2 domain-containing protein n=1 Tax=Steinernema glaseri TaxID=37863 RepID=A0A1I7ZM12_9BILA
MSLLFIVLLLISSFGFTNGDEVIDLICRRNPQKSYCSNQNIRKAPENPFAGLKTRPEVHPTNQGSRWETSKAFRSKFEQSEEEDFDREDRRVNNRHIELSDEEDESVEVTTRRPVRRPATRAPIQQNILYTVLPTLQKKTYKYCPHNQYTFQTTCAPGKKLRYDLQVFCEEYASYCGVPNINLYPSRYRNLEDEGRPKGYGQKQKNGNLGLGRSFALGLGVIPGFEVVGSRGADIGSMPGLDMMGGLMFNEGTDVGILGQRTGRGPARSLDALSHGIPSFGLDPNTKMADEKVSDAALRALGVPPVPGLGKILGALNTGKKPKKGGIKGYEPGFDAVDKKALIATGRTDTDSVNVPALGTVEINKGVGMGIGK